MYSISMIFLFENLFWNETRRNKVTQQWLMENPAKTTNLCDAFIECIDEILFGNIKFKMTHQMMTFFATEKYPILFRILNDKELPYVFHLFRHREKIFKVDKELGGGMFSLEQSRVNHIIENIIPRKSLVISYIKQILEIAGLQMKRTLHLAIRKILHKHQGDEFLILLNNFFQSNEGTLRELDHLPGDLGLKPSKRKRNLNINWEVIVSDLTKKKNEIENFH